MDNSLLYSLLLSLIISCTFAQQNYSANSALDCDSPDETGPSPAFLYTCNGKNNSCEAFLIFKSQPSFDSVPIISSLASSDQEALARINNVTRLAKFPANQEVIVPVYCSCLGQYYQANTTFHASNDNDTYYLIASHIYEGLSTCASLKRANTYGELDLGLGIELQVPLRCACPTVSQVNSGINYLVTYPISSGDTIGVVAKRFSASEKIIIDANGLQENSTIFPDTTILIPLPTKPPSSKTIIHKDPPELSPPWAPSPKVRKSKRKIYEWVGIAAACSLLIISFILAVLFYLYKERRDKVTDNRHELKQTLPEDLRVEIASVEQVLKVFGVEELKKATENFSAKNRIKGSVFWGEFDGEILAVKKISRDVSKEVNILKKLNHFNLIKLHGVCENLGCFYLVFEYMKNGSLQEWLSNKKFQDIEIWSKRIRIALDVANGLYYLHSFTEPACVHMDIKTSNILLDSNLRAKIANFSLARAAARGTANVALTKHVEGTRGYMAPEYVQAGQVTPKIDVYAFGVVLLELITGKNAVLLQNGRESLLSTAIASIMEKENAEAELGFFIDPSSTGSHEIKLALCLARVSFACLTQEPARRPGMREVVSALLKIQADLEKSEPLKVASTEVAVPLWCSSIGKTNWRSETISK